MNKAYQRINFENAPSTNTPINATNLNKMDKAINDIDDRVVEFANTKDAMAEATTKAIEATEGVEQAIEEAVTVTKNAEEAMQAVFDEKYILTARTEFEKSALLTPTAEGNAILESVLGASFQKQLSGKNLFDESKSINGFVNGSLVQSSVTTYKISELYPVGQYIVSWGESTALYVYIIYYDKNKNISKRAVYTTSSVSSANIDQTLGASYFAVMYSYGGEDGKSYTYNIQVESGTVATDYEPYCGGIPSPSPSYPQEIESVGESGSIVIKVTNSDETENNTITIPLSEPLRAINDVKDEICVQDGVYATFRRIAEVVLNGSEEWVANGSAQAYATVISNVGGNIYSGTLSNVLCDKLVAATHKEVNTGAKNNAVATLGDVHRIYIRFDETITSVDLLKAKLAENPITVQYELATPVFEPFADQTPFYELMAYDEVTNVSFEGLSENVSPTATIRFPRNEDGAMVTTNWCNNRLLKIEDENLRASNDELKANNVHLKNTVTTIQYTLSNIQGKLDALEALHNTGTA